MAERKIERAQEQEEMFERMRLEDERRKADEEERKAKAAAEKEKRDLRLKKATGGAYHVPKKPAGKNFTIVKKDPEESAAAAAPGDSGGVMPSKEEMEEKRAEHVAALLRRWNFDGLGADDLKEKIKELYGEICKAEAARYDLEKRQERQEYDMRELEERERQKARQDAIRKGLDAEEAAASKHPPKVQVQSKYDRQIDRRSYGDRHTLFDKPKPERKPKVTATLLPLPSLPSSISSPPLLLPLPPLLHHHLPHPGLPRDAPPPARLGPEGVRGAGEHPQGRGAQQVPGAGLLLLPSPPSRFPQPSLVPCPGEGGGRGREAPRPLQAPRRPREGRRESPFPSTHPAPAPL